MEAQRRRLAADHERLRAWCAARAGAARLVSVEGVPPVRYVVELDCRGPERLAEAGPVLRGSHRFQIDIPHAYPLKAPRLTMLTPTVNPHIWTSGTVCLGGFWNAGQALDLLAAQMWRILTWDPAVIDPNSPADGAAIGWYMNNRAAVPFDRTDPAAPPLPAGPAAEPEPAAPPPPRIAW